MKHRIPLLVFLMVLAVQPAGAMWMPSNSTVMTCTFEENQTRDVCAEWIDFNGNVAGYCCVPESELENPFTTYRPENCGNFFFRPTGGGAVAGSVSAPLSAYTSAGRPLDEPTGH